MRDITGVIVRRARETLPLSRDDALYLFRSVAEWVQESGNNPPDCLLIQGMVKDRVRDRSRGLRYAITNKYRYAAARHLKTGYTAVELHREAEAIVIARRAMDEFRREFRALPAQLRHWITPERFEWDPQQVGEDLVGDLQLLVWNRGWKQERDRASGPHWVLDIRDLLQL
jgi:hypothetical protein